MCRGRLRLRSQRRRCLTQSGALVLFIHRPSAAAAVPGALGRTPALLPPPGSRGGWGCVLAPAGTFQRAGCQPGTFLRCCQGTQRGTPGQGGRASRAGFGSPLPAAGNKGAVWRLCHEPTPGPVSLLCRGKGDPGPRGGWRRWQQPRVSLGAPGDSGSHRVRWPPVLLGLGAGASPSCPQPQVARGGPGPSGAANPARSRCPFPATGAIGAMPRGQRGRSPAAVPRPLSRAPDVTAEPGQCHRATSSPCGCAWDDITGPGDLIAHGRVPGDATGVPCTAAERHRSTDGPGRMTQRHDVTHCGR